ncbi:seryl-tRNA synthetase, partial [Coemansia sp. RSA 2399]
MAALRPSILHSRMRSSLLAHLAGQARALSLPSFDYKRIRDNAHQLLDNAIKRNVKDAQPHKVGRLYDKFCSLTTAIVQDRHALNMASAKLAKGKHSGLGAEEVAIVRAHARACKAAIQTTEASLAGVQAAMEHEASLIPNTSHPDAPVGDESHAHTVRIHGLLHTIDRVPEDGIDITRLSNLPFADHLVLAERLGLVDMAAGASVAGSRFHYWRGAGALLELAL